MGDKVITRCRKGKVVKVLRGNGYYIGTLDNDGTPYCRISEKYWLDSKEAEAALKNLDFKERECIENLACSENKTCIRGK